MKDRGHSTAQKILIRAVNWVGDAVMTTPAIGVIREHFPSADISILANPMVAEIFSAHGWIDRVITFDRNGRHKGITGRLKLAAELRGYAFDLAIILPNSFDSALVPWLAGIPVRLGKSSDGRGLLLTDRYKPGKDAPVCHEVEYYLNLLNHFGIDGQIKHPQLFVTPEEDELADLKLQQHGIQHSDFLVGINPGAAFGSAKRWYPDRFAEVARQLADERSAKIVIFGGPGEADIAASIENHLAGNCLNMAGKTTVRELMSLIKKCNFFVTNDSGPMHIAAAFGVPLVAIFGSTDHTGTSPYSNNAVIVRKDTPCAPCKLRECPTNNECMSAVSIDDVVDASKALLDRIRS